MTFVGAAGDSDCWRVGDASTGVTDGFASGGADTGTVRPAARAARIAASAAGTTGAFPGSCAAG